MRHAITGAVALFLLAGCAGQVPDSGVGFGDYDAYQAEQAAAAQARAQAQAPQQAVATGAAITADELASVGIGPLPSRRLAVGAPLQPAAPVAATRLPAGREGFNDPIVATGPATPSVTATPSATAPAAARATGPSSAATGPAAGETREALAGGQVFTPGFGEVDLPDGVVARDTLAEAGRQGVEASPLNAAPVIVDNPALSTEQDFDAVSDARSIEDDAALRERQAAAYRVLEPGALPQRTENSGPNIVAYALQTTNARGQRLFTRFAPSQQRFQRNCAAYRNADEAQRDFLARGGPQRDRLGIDPDGDGFACGWDPAPFRAARAG